MRSKNIAASLLVCGILVPAFALAKAGNAEFAREYSRISDKYEQYIQAISTAKDANEWDEHYHKLEAFIARPGVSQYSNQAMCMHLKKLSVLELEYLQSMIHTNESKSLDDCKTELLGKIEQAQKMRKVSFDLDSDVAAIRPIQFEERVIEEKYDYFSFQGLNKKEVMLTFDDGPSPVTTKTILKSLKQAGVKAAFFNKGITATSHPELVKELLSEGHILGSHTYFHTINMAEKIECGILPYDYFMSEFVSGHYKVFKAAHFIDPFFRFPNGSHNDAMRKNVAELGLKMFGWNIDSEDWQYAPRRKTPENPEGMPPMMVKGADGKMRNAGPMTYEERRQTIFENVVKALHENSDRGIILMHDISSQSIEALPLVLNYLSDNGYKVVLLKPANRDLSPNQEFPMIGQVDQYLSQNNLSPLKLVPGNPKDMSRPVFPLDFKEKVSFQEMFPQLSRPVFKVNSEKRSCVPMWCEYAQCGKVKDEDGTERLAVKAYEPNDDYK